MSQPRLENITIRPGQVTRHALAFSRTRRSNSRCSFGGSGGGPGLEKSPPSWPSSRRSLLTRGVHEKCLCRTRDEDDEDDDDDEADVITDR